MHLGIFFVTTLLQAIYVKGLDLNSILPRTVCYNDQQKGCNTRFIDENPELSRSVTNLTEAETPMLLLTGPESLEDPEMLNKCGGRLPPDSKFNPEYQTIVIFIPFIAGFCDVAVYREWVIELFKVDRYNIIVTNYVWAQRLDYATAVLNAKLIVAKQVNILLRNIKEQIGVDFVNLTFVGHSLGAQLAGQVGHLYGRVDRIIGIDPAGPGFAQEQTLLSDRLDPSDAKLVEVWHCNAGPCLPFLGIDYEAGHVNFYINGGTVQPACIPYAFKSILRLDWFYGFGTLFLPTTCWHAHCAVYFKTAINAGDCQHVGVKCNSLLDFKLGKCRNCGENGENCLIMGWDTAKYIKEIPSTPQVYYVKTTLHCPYCNKRYVKLEGYEETYKSSLQSNKEN